MGDVSVDVDGAVAVLTISSPGARNALTPDMGRQLVAHCESIDANPGIGALVVRGAGGTFCSGADTRGWRGDVDVSGEEDFAETSLMYGAFLRLGRVKVPSVAAVRGAAVGAGLNIAFATDLRVVATDARLIGGFAAAGIHPGGGFFTLAARLGGREAAAALGLFSTEIVGSRAAEWGLALEAVPDADVENRAMDLAARAGHDPELARRARSIFVNEVGPPAVSWEVAIEMERGTQMWSRRRRQLTVQ